MPVTTRIEPIAQDINVIISEELSPAGRSKAFAAYAGETIEDARQSNARILGRMPRSTTFVDGSEGAPLSSVKPDGVIVAEFELVNDVLAWIGEQLVRHSPVKSGRYAQSHALFADGREVPIGAPAPKATEFVFVNTAPYARRIERGSSSQAPDGVYQAVAMLARRRFGNIAKISFSFRTAMPSNERNPAIVVKLGDR